MIPRRRFLAALGTVPLTICACRRSDQAAVERPPGPVRITFKHQPFWGDPEPLRRLIAAFEHEHPDVEITAELLPFAPGAVHQYYVTAFDSGMRDFDVCVIDVIWVAEFARAGWIADLSAAFAPEQMYQSFLPGAAEAVVFGGRTFAVPWYVDVGVLFRRKDLLPLPPTTYDEVISLASEAMARRPPIYGYLWQGLQSEALVCNVYEVIWGYGGATMGGGRVLLDTAEARAALEYLRYLLLRGISPPSVTSMGEEESRRVFQAGGAALMRNWPYAWAEAQSAGSPIRGLAGLTSLPTATGELGHGALGGFQIALNANSPEWKRDAALRFIAHITSPQANLLLALAYGRLPSRREVYSDDRLLSASPMFGDLLPIVERAKPRPVTPYYPMISDTIAAEFSAAITGIRSATEALRRAQELVDHLMGKES